VNKFSKSINQNRWWCCVFWRSRGLR